MTAADPKLTVKMADLSDDLTVEFDSKAGFPRSFDVCRTDSPIRKTE